jgi:DNA polymerase-3 subunit gamma/tau
LPVRRNSEHALSYLVLARKYRPQGFDALVGQDHIARALRNAIAMQRVPHALLFCGARGTGKTTTARIVARMLNCERGPTAEPCGECAPCREISAGSSIDVHELDAASNRGIDEIRELRSGVGYAPARDRNKVYIVDEAHMLTDAAANAFLKTLEEPPPHVIFILATTDPQRLPVTIRSRCQRYDFRRVKASEVVGRLRAICDAEGVQADPAALYLVAREGEGSMRDSLSVLDQVIAFGGSRLDETTVAALLGVADRARTQQLLGALVRRETEPALRALAAANDHGVDLRTFARTMALEARDLLVVRMMGHNAKDLVDRADNEIEALRQLGEGAKTPELERLAHVLLELAEQVARARHPRLALEMGLVRLCRAATLVDVADLAVRVEGLLQGGPPPRSDPGRGQGSGPVQGPTGSRPPPPGAGAAPVRTTAPVAVAAVAPSIAAAPALELAPPPDVHQRTLTDADLAPWQDAVRDKLGQPVHAALLDQCVVQDGRGGRVVLGFATEFMAESARDPAALKALHDGLHSQFGGRWQVSIGAIDARASRDSLGVKRLHTRRQQREVAEAALRSDPRVQALVQALDGEIVQVVPAAEPAPAMLPIA